MIFIILGTQKFQLNRLLRMVDEEIKQGKIKEEVFAQIGNSDYLPQNYKYTKFMDKCEFEKKVGMSDMIITHSGVGSIITALTYGKPVIVFPRMKEYNEHVDDHQSEIADAFAVKKYVVKYQKDISLHSQIEKAKQFKYEKYISQNKKMVDTIKAYINENVYK